METDLLSDSKKAHQYALNSKSNLLIAQNLSGLAYCYNKIYRSSKQDAYIDSTQLSYAKSLTYIQLISNPAAKKRALLTYYLNNTYANPSAEYFAAELQVYKEALKLSENDRRFDELTAQLYNNIGSITRLSGKFDEAETYLLKGYKLSKDNESVMVSNRLLIMKNLSNLYVDLKQYEKALDFEREAKELIRSENQKQFDNNTKSLEIFYKTEQKNQKIKQLEEKNKIHDQQKLLYLSIISLTIIGIVFMIFLLRFKQKINKQKTDLLEIEKNKTTLILKLEKEEKARLRAEQELLAVQQERLQKQVLAANLQLDQKNIFINKLKENIKDKKDPNLNHLLKEEQIMDQDFSEIDLIIQEVHPILFKRLNEISKNKLTNLDLKYAAYIYLNMDNQQIASILKSDPNTIKTTKYRFKQKIGLKKEIDLHTFIRNLVDDN